MKRLIAIFYFQVGVNVVGLPDIRKNRIYEIQKQNYAHKA
jgi:hypothetical protein